MKLIYLFYFVSLAVSIFFAFFPEEVVDFLWSSQHLEKDKKDRLAVTYRITGIILIISVMIIAFLLHRYGYD